MTTVGKEVEPVRTARGVKRWILLASGLALIVSLFALLIWGTVRSDGRPGGLIINTKFGEVKVKQGPARPFELPLFGGGNLSLEDLRGKVVMVDFWASWCPPCRQEAPVLAKVYQEYRERGVEFVGVSIWDTEEGAKGYIRRYGIAYPNGLDGKGLIAIDYAITGIPEKYFINRDGVMLRKFIGPMNEEKLEVVLDELLAQ